MENRYSKIFFLVVDMILERKKLWEKNYGLTGHSAVQICPWTIKALRRKGVCYKQKFYGIDCARCCQMSPVFAWCTESCVYCWRPTEWMKKIRFRLNEVDNPKNIIDEIVKKRRILLSGVGGAYDVDKEKFRESFNEFPCHWAISLSGEPTLYSRLPELIKLLRKNKETKSVFLVTNGQEPTMLKKLKGSPPTQLYISVSAPNEKLFRKINKPIYTTGWKRLRKSLSVWHELLCKKVIRFTLIHGVNDKCIEQYAKLFEYASPDFIEVKSYMYLGTSRKRLSLSNMPTFENVLSFSKLLEQKLENYRIKDYDKASRVVLIEKYLKENIA